MNAINATFKDEMTGEMVVRELGTVSEFWEFSEGYKSKFCQDWAEEKGNKQHNTFLTFVSWERKY